MREVESQFIFGHQGALLIHLLSQHLSQCIIQYVCCRVVLCHQRPASVVDLSLQHSEENTFFPKQLFSHLNSHRVTHFQVSLGVHLANVQDIASLRSYVRTRKVGRLSLNRSGNEKCFTCILLHSLVIYILAYQG